MGYLIFNVERDNDDDDDGVVDASDRWVPDDAVERDEEEDGGQGAHHADRIPVKKLFVYDVH